MGQWIATWRRSRARRTERSRGLNATQARPLPAPRYHTSLDRGRVSTRLPEA
jgi:hypothetical protein